jgi:hypothetical protein
MPDGYGGAQVLLNNSGTLGGAGAWDSQAEEELRRQRDLLFQTLNEGRAIWDNPLGQQLAATLGAGMSGTNVPFTDQVQARLFSQQADSNAAAEGQRAAQIRRHFTNSGMSGGGGELALLLAGADQRAAANNAALSDIRMRSQLENFGAMERARDATQNYFSSRAAAESPYRLAEANARGRFEVTGVAPGGTNIGFGANPYGGMPSAQQAGAPGGGLFSGSGGGSAGGGVAPSGGSTGGDGGPRASTSQFAGTLNSSIGGGGGSMRSLGRGVFDYGDGYYGTVGAGARRLGSMTDWNAGNRRYF